MIALISDPFGFGWNIFGTRHYQEHWRDNGSGGMVFISWSDHVRSRAFSLYRTFNSATN